MRENGCVWSVESEATGLSRWLALPPVKTRLWQAERGNWLARGVLAPALMGLDGLETSGGYLSCTP